MTWILLNHSNKVVRARAIFPVLFFSFGAVTRISSYSFMKYANGSYCKGTYLSLI